MNNNQRSILVTGGAGFIGSNFVLGLAQKSADRIINVDKLTYAGNMNNLQRLDNNGKHVFVHADIGDTQSMDELLETHRPYAVINFAAESHVDRSIHGPDAFVETNVLGTFRLLKSVRKYYEGLTAEEKSAFRFLHVSTDEVYGTLKPEDTPFTETTPHSPNSPYAASKAASDHFVRAWHHTYGLPVLTTNCSNNYGPYQFPEKLIPLTIMNALSGKPLPIYGDGQQVRDWLYVGDHCDAIIEVLEKGTSGETYNIGGWNEKTNMSIVHTICEILDAIRPRKDGKSYKSQITHVADRPGHDRRYAIDARKIEKEIGWKPKETFETGIQKTIQWYLQNDEWLKNVASGEYQTWVDKNYAQRQG